jgi:hypothetical protein
VFNDDPGTIKFNPGRFSKDPVDTKPAVQAGLSSVLSFADKRLEFFYLPDRAT